MKKTLALVLALTMVVGLLASCGQAKTTSSSSAAASSSKASSAASSSSSAASSSKASSAAASSSKASSAASTDPILIGVSDMETGSMAAGGLCMKNAIAMAVEEINAAGGVLGRKLQTYLVDDTGTATGAATAVNKILSQKVCAVIGPHTSPMVNASLQYFQKAGIPFISAATSPAIRDKESDQFFRISVSDASVGSVMVKFAAETLGSKKIGIIYNTDDYGKAAMNAAVSSAKEAKLDSYAEGMTSTDTDVSAQLLKIKDWGADVIFSFTHDADSALVLRQLYELGMHDIKYVGPNALPMPQVLNLVDGAALDGCYASTDYFADESDKTLQEFIKKFAAKWNGLAAERYAAMYYSATYLMADAIKRAGSTDSKAIKDALASTKDFKCVLGTLNCDKNHDLNSNLFIVKIDAQKNCTVAKKVALG